MRTMKNKTDNDIITGLLLRMDDRKKIYSRIKYVKWSHLGTEHHLERSFHTHFSSLTSFGAKSNAKLTNEYIRNRRNIDDIVSSIRELRVRHDRCAELCRIALLMGSKIHI